MTQTGVTNTVNGTACRPWNDARHRINRYRPSPSAETSRAKKGDADMLNKLGLYNKAVLSQATRAMPLSILYVHAGSCLLHLTVFKLRGVAHPVTISSDTIIMDVLYATPSSKAFMYCYAPDVSRTPHMATSVYKPVKKLQPITVKLQLHVHVYVLQVIT